MSESKEAYNDEVNEPDLPETRYIPGQHKLNSFNWLSDIPSDDSYNEVVEVRFKNTRKGYYRNVNGLRLSIGEIVAVEASPGHDIGRISMVGKLVDLQMKQQKIVPQLEDLKKIYRKAKIVDLQKWEEARKLEVATMLKSRKISEDLGLNMKIGDVEYQGDKTKAIFYYIADDRVDFRELIKVLAENFRVRIEMRQIGARQEAGRIGGIGSCGRELCCSSYMKNFVSVTTTHARYQELSLNPQKLAGQCSKLKCCLNYELDGYIDRQKGFPSKEIPLHLQDGTAYYMKTEIYKGLYWYSFDPNIPLNMTPVPVARVREIQEMNRKGEKPQRLIQNEYETDQGNNEYNNVVGNESITRFDSKGEKKKSRKYRNKRKNKKNEGNR